MDTYIHQHLGIGDIILCNGLIRHLLEKKLKKEKIYLFTKNCHLKATKFMYRDENRIKIIGINEFKNEKKEVNKIINKISRKKDIDFLKIGHEFYNQTLNLNIDKSNPWPCDIVFYKQLNIPFKFRFTKSYWKRDFNAEKKLFNKLVKNNSPYAFIHDDHTRGLRIDDNNIDPKLKIIRNNNKDLIFNFRLIIEKASELHLMESSFRQIVETLDTKKKKLYLYKGRGGDHSINLYNNKKNKWIGTSKKWIIMKKNIEVKKNKKKIFNFF